MQREKQKRRQMKSERNWKRQNPLVCVQVFLFVSPHVAILSLQQHLSVALCVAQWLINMCPSRRITLASESLQTYQRTFWTAETSFLPPLSPLPPIPFPPFHFDGWWFVQSCGPYSTFMMWAKPIWDSISCLPALSTLKTTTILSWCRSSELITVCSGHGQGWSLLLLCNSASSSSELFTAAFFSLLFQSTHVVMSCFVSKSPRNHIWSSYGAPIDNWLSPRKGELFYIAGRRWKLQK